MKRILSLFDLTGNWSKPYRDNGYEVTQIDIQNGIDIMTWVYKQYDRNYFYGCLAAIPCTDFSLSGAAWFNDKDNDGRTFESMALVYKTLAIIQYFIPGLKFYVIENPMSRIHKLCPEMEKVRYKFNPCDFAGYSDKPIDEQYDKQTWLWGEFNKPTKKPLPRLMTGMEFKDKYGWGAGKIKGKTDFAIANYRSITPSGFAKAFYEANK